MTSLVLRDLILESLITSVNAPLFCVVEFGWKGKMWDKYNGTSDIGFPSPFALHIIRALFVCPLPIHYSVETIISS
jgi:hypothetical protein